MTTPLSTLRDRSPVTPGGFDVDEVREHFPILRRRIHGRPLVYLDNAATAQKPQSVVDALCRFYTSECSNIHRGVHALAERATRAYENARRTVQRFLAARDPGEIVFVRGTTEAINLVASGYAAAHLRPGDEILISAMEHHSNLVPWQLLCREKGASLCVAPIDDDGQLVFEEFERLLGPRTRLVALTHASNVLGTVTQAREIVRLAHERGVPVLLDGAQAVVHRPVNVADLDCDFYAFSGHKLFGPTGIGVLYGKRALLETTPPYQAGGGMIRFVSFDETTFDEPPGRFEAGTPHIAGAIGLAAAIEFVEDLGRERIATYEQELLRHATEALSAVPGLRLIGTAADKTAILSFVLDGAHPHDVGTILDAQGIATRTGHHCAQPLMERFGVPATTRVSLAMYNTHDEIDALVRALGKIREVFH